MLKPNILKEKQKSMGKGRLILVVLLVLLVVGGFVGYLNGGEQTQSRIEVPLEAEASDDAEAEDYSE